MAFGKAFAAARKAGKKEFTYEGKKYNTKVAPDTPKTGPTPTSRQGQDKGSGGRATSSGSSDNFSRSGSERTASRAPSKNSGPSSEKYAGNTRAVKQHPEQDVMTSVNRFIGGVARDGLYETVKKKLSNPSAKTRTGRPYK